MEALQRIVWVFVVCASISYSVYLVAGSALRADAEAVPLLIQDEVAPGVHYLSGIIDVSSSCSYVTIRSEQLSPKDYRLEFATTEQTATTCEPLQTPRAFTAIVRAPAYGVVFSAALNGEAIPIEFRTTVRPPQP